MMFRIVLLSLVWVNLAWATVLTCPPAQEIVPCTCYDKVIECDQATTEEKILEIFTKADFPVKEMYEFHIYDNSAITEFTQNARLGTAQFCYKIPQ